MKYPKTLWCITRATCKSALMLSCLATTQAQQSPDQSDDEIVRLSPFAVQESGDLGRYQAVEMTSGTRVRTDLMDMTQSVSVVTNEFLTDVATGRLSEALRYVAGVTGDPSIHALDSMTVRGFFVAGGSTIDGLYQFSFVNLDPVIIERVEVVKGPNAILAPQGIPGGVVNNISKKPLFKNKGYASYQGGRWDSNRTELDVNYVVRPEKFAVRVVGAFTDSDDFSDHNFHQNITVMPMFTYRITPKTDFTLQVQAYNATALANNGNIPRSVYAVGRSNMKPQEGLRRDFGYIGRNITRHQNGQNIRLFLNSQITDKLAMRIMGNLVKMDTRTTFLGANLVGGSLLELDHITGEWSWDGVTRNDNPTYTLGGQTEWIDVHNANLQNDYSYEHLGQTWKSQTVGGFAINYKSQDYKFKLFENNPTIYDFTDPSYTPPAYTLSPDYLAAGSSWNRSVQLYIAQVFSLFEDRLVLSASLSYTRNNDAGRNNLPVVPDPDEEPPTEPQKDFTLPSAGIVYKIRPDVSLYYGFTKQELPGGEDRKQGIPPHTVPSRQHEGGVRVRLFDGKLYATVAYFDILQENIYIDNMGNYQSPRPDPPLPAVLSQSTTKGVEFEFTWAVTKDLSLLGSYTQFKNRDSEGQRYPSVAEKMGGLFGRYSFPDSGSLRGLTLSLGTTYTGERPANTDWAGWNGLYTDPGIGYDPVRVQPPYWLPSYVLWEASVSYQFKKHWQVTLQVKNLFDKDYVPGTFVHSVTVGTPMNSKLIVRYEF